MKMLNFEHIKTIVWQKLNTHDARIVKVCRYINDIYQTQRIILEIYMKAQVLHTYDDDLTASTWVEYKDVPDPTITKGLT